MKPEKRPINPRYRAFGKARIDIIRRVKTQSDWDALWKPSANPFPFTWGAAWKQCTEYRVDDFAAEVGFFTDILGLTVNALGPDYAQFSSPQGDFYVAVLPTQTGEASTPPDALRLQFYLADILAVAATLEQRGIAFDTKPEPSTPGSALYLATFHTPHGVSIDLWGEVTHVPRLTSPAPSKVENQHIRGADSSLKEKGTSNTTNHFESPPREPRPVDPRFEKRSSIRQAESKVRQEEEKPSFPFPSPKLDPTIQSDEARNSSKTPGVTSLELDSPQAPIAEPAFDNSVAKDPDPVFAAPKTADTSEPKEENAEIPLPIAFDSVAESGELPQLNDLSDANILPITENRPTNHKIVDEKITPTVKSSQAEDLGESGEGQAAYEDALDHKLDDRKSDLHPSNNGNKNGSNGNGKVQPYKTWEDEPKNDEPVYEDLPFEDPLAEQLSLLEEDDHAQEINPKLNGRGHKPDDRILRKRPGI